LLSAAAEGNWPSQQLRLVLAYQGCTPDANEWLAKLDSLASRIPTQNHVGPETRKYEGKLGRAYRKMLSQIRSRISSGEFSNPLLPAVGSTPPGGEQAESSEPTSRSLTNNDLGDRILQLHDMVKKALPLPPSNEGASLIGGPPLEDNPQFISLTQASLATGIPKSTLSKRAKLKQGTFGRLTPYREIPPTRRVFFLRAEVERLARSFRRLRSRRTSED
jgi:hypothetical protein